MSEDGKGDPITLPLKPLPPLPPIAKNVSSNKNGLVSVKNASYSYLMVPVIIIGIIGMIVGVILWKKKARSRWKALGNQYTVSDSENDEDLVELKQPESSDRALRMPKSSRIPMDSKSIIV